MAQSATPREAPLGTKRHLVESAIHKMSQIDTKVKASCIAPDRPLQKKLIAPLTHQSNQPPVRPANKNKYLPQAARVPPPWTQRGAVDRIKMRGAPSSLQIGGSQQLGVRPVHSAETSQANSRQKFSCHTSMESGARDLSDGVKYRCAAELIQP